MVSKSCQFDDEEEYKQDKNRMFLIDPKEIDIYEVYEGDELRWFIRKDQDRLNPDNGTTTIRVTTTVIDDEDRNKVDKTIRENTYKGDELISEEKRYENNY